MTQKFKNQRKLVVPLLISAALLAFGMGLLIQSLYNLATIETLAATVESSHYYEAVGYASVSDWRMDYHRNNWTRVTMALLALGASIGIAFSLRGRAKML
jgi:hypothetical protein